MSSNLFGITKIPVYADGFNFATNAYLLTTLGASGSLAILIDPAGQADVLLEALEQSGAKLEKIVLTHEHKDHNGAQNEILTYYDNHNTHNNHGSHSNPNNHSNPSNSNKCNNCVVPVLSHNTLKDGEMIQFGDAEIEVLRTPGHSVGSLCLLFGGQLISGDTLFKGTCGRTDFDTGSPAQMHDSLQRLADLPPDTVVYPGHGNNTTIGAEMNRGLAEY